MNFEFKKERNYQKSFQSIDCNQSFVVVFLLIWDLIVDIDYQSNELDHSEHKEYG